MREILFKAKRKNWRELSKEEWWVEGVPIEIKEKMYMAVGYVDSERITDFEMAQYILQKSFIEIVPETLCQYTGLNDKNGERIWENDICEMVYDGSVNIYVIVWDAEEVDFKGTNGKEKYGSNFEYLGCCEEIVRIGNVFDNHELLEKNNYER